MDQTGSEMYVRRCNWEPVTRASEAYFGWIWRDLLIVRSRLVHGFRWGTEFSRDLLADSPHTTKQELCTARVLSIGGYRRT